MWGCLRWPKLVLGFVSSNLFAYKARAFAPLGREDIATSCTKASGSIVPRQGRSAAAAQEGAGSTRCGTGPPARPAAPGGPGPDVLGGRLGDAWFFLPGCIWG